jgi:predicted alpha/beta-fold hydrolase
MSRNSFKPAWWLFNRHLQTIWASKFRRSAKLLLVRERVELPDGDFIDLDWINKESKGPIILLLHGLEGSVQSSYMMGMLNSVSRQQGWRGIAMHFRGCSGESNRMPRLYHSGETKDLEYIVTLLRKREPYVSMIAVGFSLGGNVLLKWLGETGKNNLLTAAVAISVPFNLHKTVKLLGQGFLRIYDRYFLKSLKKKIQYKLQRYSLLTGEEIRNIKSLYEFDDKVTAPLHGFKDAMDYYSKSSSQQYLVNVRVPTLLIHSKDDPFTSNDFVLSSNDLSDSITLEFTKCGGHVGFVSGYFPWKARYWLEERVLGFISQQLKSG